MRYEEDTWILEEIERMAKERNSGVLVIKHASDIEEEMEQWEIDIAMLVDSNSKLKDRQAIRFIHDHIYELESRLVRIKQYAKAKFGNRKFYYTEELDDEFRKCASEMRGMANMVGACSNYDKEGLEESKDL